MSKKPNAILIMDGYGLAPVYAGNAIELEGSKNVKKLLNEYPNSTLGASGMDVGLPEGQMGNSEVGHLNIGAGRVVYQELTRITKSIKDGDFFQNQFLTGAIKNAINNGKNIHFFGLLSDGGVHSHISHLYALLKLAKDLGAKQAYVHCFMDGRDVSPTSGAGFIKDLQSEMNKLSFGKIASVCGRYYAMDRDNRWERVVKSYDMLTAGNGVKAENATVAVEKSYAENITDEFILPTNIYENGKPVALIEKEDSCIFFNFRPDRAREITRALSQKDFTGFVRNTGFINPYYICLTQYDISFTDVFVAFKPQSLKNTLGEYLSVAGYSQLRIAETEKYAHVTFFFNGGVEAPNKNEERALISSPKVATYDMQPEMSAYEVTEKVLQEIDKDKFDIIILNFANCDMVGHTGVLEAAEMAVKAVDECVFKVVQKILSKGGNALITADHGNAEKMIAEDGSVFTAHTTNRVPLILVGEKYKNSKLKNGILADIAPTLLDILGEKAPEEMTGKSLIIK
jgi:2,3-bisphosphoglycerate-independent phosphoglycerate mutase